MEQPTPTKPLPPLAAGFEGPAFWVVTAFLLLALGYLTIAGCIASPLTAYDDVTQVTRNPLLTAERGWGEIFTKPYYAQYVPLTLLSFRANYELFGREAAWSFRLVNWLIHSASGLLILLLLVRLGLRRLEALAVAMIWAVHPMACESVAWVTERSNCLAVFFGLAGLWAYTKWHGQWRGVVGGAGGFLLALLGKPAALGWFPVFVALEALGGPARMAGTPSSAGSLPPGCDTRGANTGLGRALLRLLPLAVLAAAFTVIGLVRGRMSLMPPPGGHWYTGLLTDTEIFCRYLYNIFCPVQLSAFYLVEDVRSFADPRVYLYGGALAAIVGGSTWLARSRRRALFGWLWFFGGVGPNANIVAITFTMQDRYMYLSSIGVLLVAAEVIQGLRARLAATEEGAAEGRGWTIAVGAAVVVLAALTAMRSVVWDNSLTLFKQATERQPRCGLAKIYHGIILAQAAAEMRQPGDNYDPPHAAALSAEVLAQHEAAQGCPDSYRFYNPVGVAVNAAREAVQLGRRDAARRILARDMDLTPPPAGAEFGLTEAEKKHGFRFLRRGGLDYWYKLSDVGLAHAILAEADLQEFADQATPVSRAWPLVRSAQEHVAKALGLEPDCPRAYIILAKLSLLPGYPDHWPQGDAAPAPELEKARAALAVADAPLAAYRIQKEVQLALRPPVPPGRPSALARMALADAALDEARQTKLGLDAARELAGKALAYAAEAERLDGAYADPLWTQARIHLFFDQLCEAAKDPQGSWQHFDKARELLGKIPSDAPRYGQARRMLSSLTPPPPVSKNGPRPVGAK